MGAPRNIRKKLSAARKAERDAKLLENAVKRLPKDKVALLAGLRSREDHSK